MEHFNQIFFEKKDYRKWKLLLMFQKNHTDKLLVVDMMKNYGNNHKTFYSDIASLKEDLYLVCNESELKKIAHGKFLLVDNSQVSLQKLRLFYLENSRHFWVLQRLVYKQNIKVTELKNDFYYSQSAIYSSIKNLQNNFKSLDINFSSSGIVGNEIKIRHLLVDIYWFFFGGIKWPFETDREDFFNLMDEIKEVGLVLTNEAELEKALYWQAITFMRINNKCEIKNTNKLKLEEREYKNRFRLVQKYLNIDVNKNLSSSLDNENQFLLDKFQTIFSSNKKGKESSSLCIQRLENHLLKKGKELGWTSYDCQQFEKRVKKIRYYDEKKIEDYYHYLEPESKGYFEKCIPFIEESTKLKLEKIPNKIASMYVYECKKIGLDLLIPFRLQIQSKEDEDYQIGKLLKRKSEYSIVINQELGAEVDVVLTNILSEYENVNSDFKTMIFYDFPLTDKKIQVLLEKFMDLRFTANRG